MVPAALDSVFGSETSSTVMRDIDSRQIGISNQLSQAKMKKLKKSRSKVNIEMLIATVKAI